MYLEYRKLMAGTSLVFGLILILFIALSPYAPLEIRIIAVTLGITSLVVSGIFYYISKKRG